MGTITVHAGDFLKGDGVVRWGPFNGKVSLKTEAHTWVGEDIPGDQLEAVEVASEESVKKIGGTLGWGAVGALALGPIGLLAGLLLGGKGREVTFVARFKDGRRLMATTDSATFTKLKAAAF